MNSTCILTLQDHKNTERFHINYLPEVFCDPSWTSTNTVEEEPQYPEMQLKHQWRQTWIDVIRDVGKSCRMIQTVILIYRKSIIVITVPLPSQSACFIFTALLNQLPKSFAGWAVQLLEAPARVGPDSAKRYNRYSGCRDCRILNHNWHHPAIHIWTNSAWSKLPSLYCRLNPQ